MGAILGVEVPPVTGGAKANISGDENRNLSWLQARTYRTCNHEKVYRPSAASRVRYARHAKDRGLPLTWLLDFLARRIFHARKKRIAM